MRARILGCLLLVLASTPALSATADGRVIDSYCVEDDAAVEGWYLNSSRRGDRISYLILQKKQQRTDRFYLCRLDGEERFFVRELGIEIETAAARVEAAKCTPVDSGVPGSEYFSVIDLKSAKPLRVYRFDVVEEDVEVVPAGSVVCSS